MARVMVAMSGGVDSSVAAYLLLEQGHDCVGATMLLHGKNGDVARRNEADAGDAESVAHKLGIPHRTIDLSSAFEERIVRDFAESYEAGLTPNPCVWCNRRVKFGILLEEALALGCDYLATGHYAQVDRAAMSPADPKARLRLLKAADLTKDQSYFLCLLDQGQLARTLLPLGGLTKTRVRAIAEEQGFVTAHKSESQDVCFIPDGNYRTFLEFYRGMPYEPGDVLTEDGRVVGRHDGAVGYTIGQRKGLGVALGEPAFVTGKDMRRNTVTIGPLASIMSSACTAVEWNWLIEPPEIGGSIRARARTHYRMSEQPCSVTRLPGDGRVRIDFDEPRRAITPGQFAVAYDGDAVIGGGMICAL